MYVPPPRLRAHIEIPTPGACVEDDCMTAGHKFNSLLQIWEDVTAYLSPREGDVLVDDGQPEDHPRSKCLSESDADNVCEPRAPRTKPTRRTSAGYAVDIGQFPFIATSSAAVIRSHSWDLKCAVMHAAGAFPTISIPRRIARRFATARGPRNTRPVQLRQTQVSAS